MPITDPLRSPIYETGTLLQACGACAWAQRGHRSELLSCPVCDTALGAPLAIMFGGLAVMKRAYNFEIFDRQDRRVVLEAADLTEIIQFLCRHTKDNRTGTPMHDIEQPRRVAKRQYFEDHFFVNE